MSLDEGQLLMQAFAQMQAGALDAAEQVCQKVLASKPRSADALHLMGLIRLRRVGAADALSWVDRSLALVSGNYSVHASRGAILCALGRHDEALVSYGQALALEPRALSVHCQLGAVLQLKLRWQDSLKAYERALALDPGFAMALDGQGLSQLELGDLHGAEQSLRAAIARAEGNPPLRANAANNLGKVLWSQGRLDEALRCYQDAVNWAPGDLGAWKNLGHTLRKMSRVAEAREAFDRAYRLSPGVETLILRELMLPHLLESHEQIAQSRADFERGLASVLALTPEPQAVRRELFCDSLFYLAFHGRNDRDLMGKVAQFYLALCPELDYRAPHIDRAAAGPRKPRVGFFSVNVQDHAVSRCFAKLIGMLAEQGDFEVFLVSTRDPASNAGVNPYADFKGHTVTVPRLYQAAREAVAALELDMLVYQDIGMDELSYFLAFGRLAGMQCVMGGHPVTTGIPQVDCYVSTALAESLDAQVHYSEELLLLDGLPVIFAHPDLPQTMKTRADFGLPAAGALYVCPMKLQKMHPDFDSALRAILERDPTGHVVLFRDRQTRWEDILMDRFQRSIPDEVLRSRIIFLPWLHDFSDFVAVNALADVVLDPFHFGIGSTVIATFAVCTPIVTWPGEFLRGRAGLAYCRLVEAHECVAVSQEDYVATALALAHDRELNQRVRATIARNKHRLFDNASAVPQLAGLLSKLNERLRGPHD